MYARVPEYALMHFQAKNSKENRDTRRLSSFAIQLARGAALPDVVLPAARRQYLPCAHGPSRAASSMLP